MTSGRYPYLRPLKAAAMQRVCDSIVEKSDFQIRSYRNVLLRPLGQIYNEEEANAEAKGNGAEILYEDTRMAASVGPCDSSNSENRVLEGKTLYGGYLRFKWGHFITESLARLWALLDNEKMENVDHILFFSDTPGREISGNFRRVFELLGIADKVVLTDSPVIVEDFEVPEIAYEHDRYISPQQRAVVEKIRDGIIASASDVDDDSMPDKIFFTRSAIPGMERNAINIRRLDRFFESAGYKVISPELLSLDDLVLLMRKASTIAAISGSVAHNFIFAPNAADKKLVIIERHPWANVFQAGLDKMMSLGVVYVDGYHLPRPVSSQDSVTIFSATPELQRFATDESMSTDPFGDDSCRQRRRELSAFLRRYRRYYGHSDGIVPWEVESGVEILEAMVASRERYSPWLEKFLPLYFTDWFHPRFLLRYLRYRLRK